jgi:hypothetical protein
MSQGSFTATIIDRPAIRAAPVHRKDIDGLRAVAVLSVLGFHTSTPGFSGGFVGVDVFLVLSGYLICSIIVREIEQGSFSVARFYERRCKRILPALFAVLIFFMVVALCVLSPIEAQHLGSEIMATALSVSNLHFYQQRNYFGHGGIFSPLQMTWPLPWKSSFTFSFHYSCSCFTSAASDISSQYWLADAGSHSYSRSIASTGIKSSIFSCWSRVPGSWVPAVFLPFGTRTESRPRHNRSGSLPCWEALVCSRYSVAPSSIPVPPASPAMKPFHLFSVRFFCFARRVASPTGCSLYVLSW